MGKQGIQVREAAVAGAIVRQVAAPAEVEAAAEGAVAPEAWAERGEAAASASLRSRATCDWRVVR
jgi:hypothetical protein